MSIARTHFGRIFLSGLIAATWSCPLACAEDRVPKKLNQVLNPNSILFQPPGLIGPKQTTVEFRGPRILMEAPPSWVVGWSDGQDALRRLRLTIHSNQEAATRREQQPAPGQWRANWGNGVAPAAAVAQKANALRKQTKFGIYEDYVQRVNRERKQKQAKSKELFVCGLICYETGHHREAIEFFTEAMKAQGQNDPRSLGMRALAWRGLGDLTKALKDVTAAHVMVFDQDHPRKPAADPFAFPVGGHFFAPVEVLAVEVLNNRGVILAEMGGMDKAALQFQRALTYRQPGAIDFLKQNHAISLCLIGKPQEALKLLREIPATWQALFCSGMGASTGGGSSHGRHHVSQCLHSVECR